MKSIAKKGNKNLNHSSVAMKEKEPLKISNEPNDSRSADEIKKLKLLIQQRDNEITLLLSLINKKKNNPTDVTIPVHRANEEENLLQSVVKDKVMEFKESSVKMEENMPSMNEISSIEEKKVKKGNDP